MATKKTSKATKTPPVPCGTCNSQSVCCRMGAWADLEEAKKIVSLGLKGEFFQLEIDKDFPSGFRIGTSYENEPCTFQDDDGLCSIHKISYDLKPRSCKEFPLEKGKISPFARELCPPLRKKLKK